MSRSILQKVHIDVDEFVAAGSNESVCRVCSVVVEMPVPSPKAERLESLQYRPTVVEGLRVYSFYRHRVDLDAELFDSTQNILRVHRLQ